MIEENCSELNGLKVWKPKGFTVVHTKSLRIYFSKICPNGENLLNEKKHKKLWNYQTVKTDINILNALEMIYFSFLFIVLLPRFFTWVI